MYNIRNASAYSCSWDRGAVVERWPRLLKVGGSIPAVIGNIPLFSARRTVYSTTSTLPLGW